MDEDDDSLTAHRRCTQLRREPLHLPRWHIRFVPRFAWERQVQVLPSYILIGIIAIQGNKAQGLGWGRRLWRRRFWCALEIAAARECTQLPVEAIRPLPTVPFRIGVDIRDNHCFGLAARRWLREPVPRTISVDDPDVGRATFWVTYQAASRIVPSSGIGGRHDGRGKAPAVIPLRLVRNVVNSWCVVLVGQNCSAMRWSARASAQKEKGETFTKSHDGDTRTEKVNAGGLPHQPTGSKYLRRDFQAHGIWARGTPPWHFRCGAGSQPSS